MYDGYAGYRSRIKKTHKQKVIIDRLNIRFIYMGWAPPPTCPPGTPYKYF